MIGEQEILGGYADLGFNLQKPDDDTLELYFKDARVKSFSQIDATKRRIREACKKFLEKIRREIKDA